jgi:hypothetical protein
MEYTSLFDYFSNNAVAIQAIDDFIFIHVRIMLYSFFSALLIYILGIIRK